MPFFAVIVPTRSRQNLLPECVRSVLLQDFKDVEVIVSDNSNNTKTRECLEIENLLGSVKYIRPEGELSMPDHWEFASHHVQGDYVLFLTDRSVLKQGALKYIHDQIQAKKGEFDVKVVSWKWDLFDDEYKMLLPEKRMRQSGSVIEIKSEQLIQEFLETKAVYPYSRPRALNSCYSKQYGEYLRGKYGRIFSPIAPDDHFAFLVLADLDSILYLNKSLFISRGLNASSGGKAYYSPPVEYFKTMGKDSEIKFCPTKMPSIVNANYEDFFRCLSSAGKPTTLNEEQWVEYYVKSFWGIYLQLKFADPIYFNMVTHSRKEWETALGKESDYVQKTVQKKITGDRFAKLKKLLQGQDFVRMTVRFLRYFRAKLRGHVYKGVLPAAGFD